MKFRAKKSRSLRYYAQIIAGLCRVLLPKNKGFASSFREQRKRNCVHLCYIMKKKNCQQPKDSKNGIERRLPAGSFGKKEKPAPDGVGDPL
jgi:hypothetical protein